MNIVLGMTFLVVQDHQTANITTIDPIADAIKAYKAIGYRCIEVEIIEKRIVEDDVYKQRNEIYDGTNNYDDNDEYEED